MVMVVNPPSEPASTVEKTKDGEPAPPMRSFIESSDERLLNAGIDVSRQMDGNSQEYTEELTTYGWARGIWLRVTTSGGAAGLNNAVLHEDGPWNALGQIKISEPNGRDHIQWSTGFHAYLANKWGGYAHPLVADPKSDPDYTGGGNGGNFVFWLWCPFELSARSGLGAQSNMDDSGQIKVQFTLNPAGSVFTTQPDVKPIVRVRGYLSAWDPTVPMANGMSQAATPPAAGLTQYWSSQNGISVPAGLSDVRIKRKGNHYRKIIFILRRAGSTRANGESDWGDESKFVVDEFTKAYIQDDLWRLRMYKVSGYGAAGVANESARGLDNGVRVLDFTDDFDGLIGRELRQRWLPSLGTTSVRLDTNLGNAGTMDVLINDVAIPAGREAEVFHA
jgi:hypothetical protein